MPQVDKDGDIRFQYQMRRFFILINEKDEYYLRICLPGIYQVDENNRVDVLEACNAVSANLKVAKCYITPRNHVWATADQLLDKTPNYEDVIPRSIRILMDAQAEFYKQINE